MDLLNNGIPAEWRATRYCPTCGSVELCVSSDDPLADGWCTTSCASCGRELRVDRLDCSPWEDPEWVSSGSRN